jgi:hypothetical protein
MVSLIVVAASPIETLYNCRSPASSPPYSSGLVSANARFWSSIAINLSKLKQRSSAEDWRST